MSLLLFWQWQSRAYIQTLADQSLKLDISNTSASSHIIGAISSSHVCTPRFPYVLRLVHSVSNAAWDLIPLMLLQSSFILLLMGVYCAAEFGTGVVYYYTGVDVYYNFIVLQYYNIN